MQHITHTEREPLVVVFIFVNMVLLIHPLYARDHLLCFLSSQLV
jgi:hypothetical protein